MIFKRKHAMKSCITRRRTPQLKSGGGGKEKIDA